MTEWEACLWEKEGSGWVGQWEGQGDRGRGRQEQALDSTHSFHAASYLCLQVQAGENRHMLEHIYTPPAHPSSYTYHFCCLPATLLTTPCYTHLYFTLGPACTAFTLPLLHTHLGQVCLFPRTPPAHLFPHGLCAPHTTHLPRTHTHHLPAHPRHLPPPSPHHTCLPPSFCIFLYDIYLTLGLMWLDKVGFGWFCYV